MVIGEVCHPRSKLAGYSTDTNNPRYAGSLINREYKKLNVDVECKLKASTRTFEKKSNLNKPARTGSRDFCKKVIKFRFREKIPISAFLTGPGFREESCPVFPSFSFFMCHFV